MLKFGPFTLDTEKRMVQRDGVPRVTLTPFETAVMKTLAQSPGQTVLREEIHAAMYPNGHPTPLSPQSNGLEVMIRRLRTKLDPDNDLRLITTVRGRGYALRLWEEEARAAA